MNAKQYPTWGSLAQDHLSIMSSSVSSEWAFLSGGITISKRQNRLKGDIVEALQCLKCLICCDLMFWEPMDYESDEEGLDEEGWDDFLNDAEDNEDNTMDVNE
jgi:hypothetical protein